MTMLVITILAMTILAVTIQEFNLAVFGVLARYSAYQGAQYKAGGFQAKIIEFFPGSW